MTTLDEIKRLLAEATPGPWEYFRDDGGLVSGIKPIMDESQGDWDMRNFTFADAALIAALRNIAPQLIAVVEAAAEACTEYYGDSEEREQIAMKALKRELLALTSPVSPGKGGEP